MIRNERSQTKTIVTLGPASSSYEVMKQLYYEGVDVFRLNMSHSAHDEHRAIIKQIRALNKELDVNVAILADLQGPKIRIGMVEEDGIFLDDGDTLIMSIHECLCCKEKLFINYADFPKDVKAGEKILVDDGKIRLEVIETNREDEVKVKVLNGGKLTSRKGVNLPDTKVSLPSLTEKDLHDLEFALEENVDWIALSFVRSVEDIDQLRKKIAVRGNSTFIIAKIEKPEALEQMNEIIDAADAVMVARGDLGVELSFEKVPIAQKQIIQTCINKGKPVIVATQMLESMITNFEPTRAEVNDVANAVMDGADAVMLSAETSMGKYPVEALRNMQRIIDYTEQYGYKYNRVVVHHDSQRMLPDAICEAALKLVEKTNPNALIIFTDSGYTAFRMASYRPNVAIFAFTMNVQLISRLSLVWGVRALLLDAFRNINETIELTKEKLKSGNEIKSGDLVIHLASIPLVEKGSTNMIKESYVD
ncbi:MAG: pyruvate kinase [Bacteroidota bacterium]